MVYVIPVSRGKDTSYRMGSREGASNGKTEQIIREVNIIIDYI